MIRPFTVIAAVLLLTTLTTAACGTSSSTPVRDATTPHVEEHVPSLGLTSEAHGYRLEKLGTWTGKSGLAFRIMDGDEPLRSYETVHDRKLHLIVAGAGDGAWEFDHVHPTMDASGVWRAKVALEPGPHRVYADFTPPGGDQMVLGEELTVPGGAPAGKRPGPDMAMVDGFMVMLETKVTRTCSGGDGAPLDATLTYDVSTASGGDPAMLEPYLGALGHTVAIREDDRSYLHVHPTRAIGSEPGVAVFETRIQPGAMRVFLDFQVNGEVHSAPFRIEATRPGSCTAGSGHSHSHHDMGGHGDMEM